MKLLSTAVGKTVLAGGVAATLTVGAITFTGDSDITDIRGNINDMKDRMSQAIEDNTFLSNQFDKLKGNYTQTVAEADSKISGLTSKRDELMDEVAVLQKQINEMEGADKTETEEMIAEISRLEGELTKANEAVAELAAYSEEADLATSYEAINREEYTAEVVETQEVPIHVSAEAKALDAEKAAKLQKKKTIAKFKEEMSKELSGVEFVGVSSHNGELAYVVNKSFTFENGTISLELQEYMGELNLITLYMVTSTGEVVAKVSRWGQLTQE